MISIASGGVGCDWVAGGDNSSKIGIEDTTTSSDRVSYHLDNHMVCRDNLSKFNNLD